MNILAMTETAFGDAPGWALALQGFYDIIPTVLFMLGAIVLLRTLYPKMVKGNYALLAAGSIMVFSAGVLKALHKIVMGIGRIDYLILDKQFAPTQSIGFALLFVALIGMFTSYNVNHLPSSHTSDSKAIALPILGLVLADAVGEYGLKTYKSTMPFIVLMVIGALGFLIMLIIISAKMKRVPEIVLFSIAIVMMFGMGYLSSKHVFEYAWVQISVNIVYQGCFFAGTLLLKKHGLEDAALFTKKA